MIRIYNRVMRIPKVLPLCLALVLLIPLVSFGETNCSVSPDTLKLLQGGSGYVGVELNVPTNTPYELILGDLPTSVSGGLSRGVTGLKLSIQAGVTAQTGSFMVPILYKLSASGEESKLICQLNLVIEKNPNAKPTIFQNNLGTKTLREGELPTSFATSSDPTMSSLITIRLARGSRGAQVKLLQDLLKFLKHFPPEMESTGYFGPITELALKSFQVERELEPVGFVGPKTRKILEELSVNGI